jgi:hypothetical protein
MQPPSAANPRKFAADEFRKIELSTESIIEILAALNVPIQIGPADSAGVGFRTLRIPN